MSAERLNIFTLFREREKELFAAWDAQVEIEAKVAFQISRDHDCVVRFIDPIYGKNYWIVDASDPKTRHAAEECGHDR